VGPGFSADAVENREVCCRYLSMQPPFFGRSSRSLVQGFVK